MLLKSRLNRVRLKVLKLRKLKLYNLKNKGREVAKNKFKWTTKKNKLNPLKNKRKVL